VDRECNPKSRPCGIPLLFLFKDFYTRSKNNVKTLSMLLQILRGNLPKKSAIFYTLRQSRMQKESKSRKRQEIPRIRNRKSHKGKEPKNRNVLSEGSAKLTNKGLYFKGMLNGNQVDFTFDARAIYSLTFSTKGFLEFYHNNDYYILVPDN
jgi:hypothetical protein